MFVYFVRHGQSYHNAEGKHQGPAGGLSPLGQRQAQYAAEKLVTFPIEVIISSHFERTQETAQIINDTLGKEIIYSELAREVTQPSELHGLSHDHPKVDRVKALRRENAHNPSWHYSDEENFFDYTERARKFEQFLTQQDYKHILVVSHAVFIKVLVATLLHQEKLNYDLYRDIYYFFYTTNTGITILEKEGNAWLLKTWNDYAHVQEIEKEVIW